MMMSALLLALVCVLACTHAFITNAFRFRSTAATVTYTDLNMAMVKTFGSMKEKYGGRADLSSMVEEEGASGDVPTADYFMEADDEMMDPPKVGQTITGTVIEIDDNGALLEIGGKMSGYLPIKESCLITPRQMIDVVEIGQVISAEVIGTLKGMPVISLRGPQLVLAWETILKVREGDEPFDVNVLEVNRGGAVCECFGLKAFLPGSHFLGVPDESLIGTTLSVSTCTRTLCVSPNYLCPTPPLCFSVSLSLCPSVFLSSVSDRVSAPTPPPCAPLPPSNPQVKFLDVIEDEGKVVVSQRRALADNAPTLVRGSVIAGTVTGLRNYGAFLELAGGSAGLLHISQISYDRIENLETLFTIGQHVKVMVLDHDKSNGRVALSTKTLEPTPGDMLRDMESVFAQADETAKRYHERLDGERVAREAAAKEIVAGLGGAIEGDLSEGGVDGVDPLVSVAESIESILASIVSDPPASA
jgi:predicted RNA-binding protein with RPS1 domain